MGIEIERKFLIRDERWRDEAGAGVYYSQGYLAGNPECSIRVRIAADQAWLNIKSAHSTIRRLEYEYAIPVEEAREMMRHLCNGQAVEKTRYLVEYGEHTWEVDVFEGANAGLVVAEIELDDEQEEFLLPPWTGKEVSDDPKYYNMNLARFPYSQWS